MRAALIALAAGAGALVYWMQANAMQQPAGAQQDTSNNDFAFSGIIETVNDTIKNFSISVPDSLGDANVQAFLTLIRTGEGTADAGGYSRLFGGGTFDSYARHPGIKVPFGATYSTAAGAYQILASTWAEMQSQYDLPDFSPASQDIAAVGLIKRRGALADVIAGNFRSAITKCNREWASLPGSPYGQPTLTWERAAMVLAQQGVYSTESMTA